LAGFLIARRFREVVFLRERRLFLVTRLRETFFLEDFLVDRFLLDFLLTDLFFRMRIATFGPVTFLGRPAARVFVLVARFLPTRFGLLAVRATRRLDLVADFRATRRLDLEADFRATRRLDLEAAFRATRRLDLEAAFRATRRLDLVGTLRATFLATLLMAIVG